jgi:hypothetical protein
MTHQEKLQRACDKKDRAEKKLYKLLNSIPEVVSLQSKINKLKGQISELIWAEAFNSKTK